MIYLGLGFLVLLIGIVPVFAFYEPPTRQEKIAFDQLIEQFDKVKVPKKDVSDTIGTFQKPFINTFSCDSNNSSNQVITVVNTRLAKFEENTTHQDLITGGTYTWQCYESTDEGKITLNCNNDLRLNPSVISNDTGIEPKLHKIENLVILYHELLHGQFLIDAIKNSSIWKDEICNKEPGKNIDYSFADTNHQMINPLQTQFASELVANAGGKMITQEIIPANTINGQFTINVLSFKDYPSFESGAKITLRASNINNTSFSTVKNDVFLTGHLINGTKNGTAWFYVFSNDKEKTIISEPLPAWMKRIAGLWATGNTSVYNFKTIIDYLTEHNLIHPTYEKNSNGSIPNWFKKNAQLWYGGEIDDNTFTKSIQYMISARII